MPGMKLGMVGLGRMGANMARRLAKGGHSVVAMLGEVTHHDAAHVEELGPRAEMSIHTEPDRAESEQHDPQRGRGLGCFECVAWGRIVRHCELQ